MGRAAMMRAYRNGLLWVLACTAISILWGASIGLSRAAWLDFRAVYAGTRCLMSGHNPYSVSDLAREYASEDGQRPSDPPWAQQSVTLYVNMPTAFVFVAPFAALPWTEACALWMLLTGGALIAAIFLTWSIGARVAPDVATILACLFAVNCEAIFCAGNTAGLVVGFCVIGVCCLLYERWVWLGVLFLGLGLAVKPHDAGLIWLYFLLAGGVHRKRALQSLLITVVIGVAGVLWVAHVSPHWIQDWSANLAAISAPGGINEPSPDSLTGHASSPVIDLQAAISVFRNDPRFYNAVSYLICVPLLAWWAVRVMRSRFSRAGAWLGLAAASAQSMLITYHRPWDAKLLMLAIPPCCVLWAERSRRGKITFAITATAVLLAGDIPLTILKTIADALPGSETGFGGQLLTLALRRPESIALLAMGAYFLWLYGKSNAGGDSEAGPAAASS